MMMMMMPASSATVRVDKATSDLLTNPDWAMNLDICDYINSYPGYPFLGLSSVSCPFFFFLLHPCVMLSGQV